MRILVSSVLLVGLVISATGQPNPANGPTIGYIYPAGGSLGSTFKVTVGGQALEGVTNLLFSQPGITARFVHRDPPITQGQINKMRDELRELMEKRKASARQSSKRRPARNSQEKEKSVIWTAQDAKSLADMQHKIELFQRQPSSPAIADSAVFQVAIAPNALPGKCQIRLQSARGLSNPLVFEVGTLPEITEPPPAQENFAGQLRKSRIATEQVPIKSRAEIKITLPAVVNGQVYPSEIDRYKFHGKKGQHIVAAVSARNLIPFLADAVPGWFQATISVSDSHGKELAYADDFHFQPDPVLHFEVPADGEYVLALKDAIYRGREDFVYRLSVGELPFITGIFPLGARSGATTPIELMGWNLPQDILTNSAAKQPGIRSVGLTNGVSPSNLLPFQITDLTSTAEKEPNNNSARAQVVQLPTIVDGRINSAGDEDLYRFEGTAGQEIVLEVIARRLGSPMDSAIRLADVTGNTVASNDDCPELGTELQTHHADSYLRTKLPATGIYVVQISDTQRQAGVPYRLRISPPRPDYELRVTPASINGRPGLSYPVTFQVIRKDGFQGEIKVSLADAPPGFKLAGGIIPAGETKVRGTLGLPVQSLDAATSIKMVGRAQAGSETLLREAVAAEDVMQAFFYRHLVPAADLAVFVGGKSWMRTPLRIVGEEPVRIPAGGTAKVAVAGPAWGFSDRVQLTLNQPPEGIELAKVSNSRGQAELTLKADAKLKPGAKGNLILDVFPNGENPGAKAKNSPAANRTRASLGALPAIPYEVVAATKPR